MKAKIIALFLFGLFLVTALPVLENHASAQTQGFQIISAQWGTSTATAEAGPGDQDVPLTLTVQYIYPYSALYAEFESILPSGFSVTSAGISSQSGGNSTLYYTNKLVQGQIFQLQTYLESGRECLDRKV